MFRKPFTTHILSTLLCYFFVCVFAAALKINVLTRFNCNCAFMSQCTSEFFLTWAGTCWGKRKLWWIQMKDEMFLHTSCHPHASFLFQCQSHRTQTSRHTSTLQIFSSYLVVYVDLSIWFRVWFFLALTKAPAFHQRIVHSGLVGVFPYRLPCIF